MAASSNSCRDHLNYNPNEEHANETLKSYLKYNAKELSASKLLFAEDFVSYIANNFYGIYYEESKTQKCRALLYDIFNDTVKEAVTFIRYQLCNKCKLSFSIICSLSEKTKDFYSEFVEDVLKHNNGDYRSDAGLFLYYCVYFVDLASRCYTKEIPEILEYAVYAVLDAFSTFDCCKWSDLLTVAEKIITFSRIPNIYLSDNRKRKKKQCVAVYPGDVDEVQMDLADNAVSPEDTFATKAERATDLRVYNCNKTDIVIPISSGIGEPGSTTSEQKLDFPIIPFTKADINYFLNLPIEVERVATYEATLFAAAFMNWEGSEKDSDDENDSLTPESEETNETISQSANFKDCKLEQVEYSDFLSGLTFLNEVSLKPAVFSEINAEETFKIMVDEKMKEDKIILGDPQCYPGDMLLLGVDRLYFAEELVAIIGEFHNIQYTKGWKIPHTFQNPLNETIRDAIHFIFWQINEMDLLRIEIEFPRDNKGLYFKKIFTRIFRHYLEGLSAGLFLYYSVYLSNIACSISDFPLALNLAVSYILELFCLLAEEWDELYNISKKIVTLSNNRELYPGYKQGHAISVPPISKMPDNCTLHMKVHVENPNMMQEIGQKSDKSECSRDDTIGLHSDMKSTMKNDLKNTFEISEGDKVYSKMHDSGVSNSSPAGFTTSEQISDPLSANDMTILSNIAMEANRILKEENIEPSLLFYSEEDPNMVVEEYGDLLENLKI